MGGNRKQANRTKNNARPANSGRSAELLGNVPPPFAGFSAVNDGAFLTVLPGFSSNVDDINLNVDPNFQLLLKKMNKKDATTKLKALQEFSELVRNSEVEAVKAILPFWPRLYCQLATDIEHRVREALHQTQRVIVSKAKRNIAPFLKQLAGPWFTSQYDTYAPAATAAQLAFQEAFPPKKQLEAINYCQEEILSYITDNLTVQTAQTLSNPKMTEPEQMEAKHQRVLVCSLQGYILYLNKLTPTQLLTADESNRRLVGSARFWKLAKHAAPLVRSAWFSVVVALCQKLPDLVVAEASHVVTATLGRLDETDPSVLPIVWEAALHVMTTVPDCWSHINADKVVLPKLYHLLREGGQGNASTIFPNLLPFLSKLPKRDSCDKGVFYDKFFTNMRTGFTQNCVVQSQSESSAVAKCYVECLKYAIITTQNDSDFCQNLIKNQLMPAIKLLLTDRRLGLLYTTHFVQVSLLVHQWDRNHHVSPNARLLEAFWTSLGELNAECLRPEREDSMEPRHQPKLWTLERQVSLCLSLKSPVQRRTVNLRVKFGGEETERANDGSPGAASRESQSEDYARSLFRLVDSLCAAYFALARSDGTTHYLGHLSKLVTAFSSKQLCTSFLSLANAGQGSGSPRSVVELFTDQLRYWVENDEAGVGPVIDITLELLKHLEPSERSAVLDAISELCAGPSAVACLSAALKHRADESVVSFLRGERTAGVLKERARAFCEGGDKPGEWETFRECCVARTPAGELIISDDVFCELVSVFELDTGGGYLTDYVLSLSVIFFSERLNEQTVSRAERFFMHLLSMSLVCAEYLAPVRSAAVSLTSAGSFPRLLEQVAAFVYEQLEIITRTSCLKMHYESDIDLVVASVFNFLSAGVSETPPVDGVLLLLEKCTPRMTALEPVILRVALSGYERCHEHQLPSGVCDCRELWPADSPSFDEVLTTHLAGLLFHMFLLEKLIPDKEQPNEDDDEEERPSKDDVPSIPAETFEPLRHHVATITKSLSLCSAFGSRYRSTVYYYKILTRFRALWSVCERLEPWEPLRVDVKILRPSREQCRAKLSLPLKQSATEPVCMRDPSVPEDVEDLMLQSLVYLHAGKVLECWPEVSRETTDPLDVFDALILLDRGRLLFETDVSDKSDLEVVAVATLAEFTARLVDKLPSAMKPEHWDFVVVALASWMQSVKKSKRNLLGPSNAFPIHPPTGDENRTSASDKPSDDDPHNHNVAVFTDGVCQLFCSFYSLLNSVVPENKIKYAKHLKIKQEWTDIFKQDTDLALIDVFAMIADCSRQKDLSMFDFRGIEAVALSLQCLDVGRCTKDDRLMALLECCLNIQCSPILVLQLAAFHVMHSLTLNLAVKDSADLLTTEDPTAQLARQTLHSLLPHLVRTQTVVSAMLADVRPGESCLVEPYTDASVYTLAYLLLWTVVLSMCEHADSVLRSQYASVLREKDYLDHLLRAVFRLMPLEVLTASHGKSRTRKTSEFFSEPPQITLGHIATQVTVTEQMACWVYWLCLCRLPAEVRKWWSNVDQRYSSLADRVTTSYVSQALGDLEMKTLQTHVPKQQSNVVIKVHPSVYEVHAVYTVDEVRLEMSMALPPNYPLTPVTLTTTNTEKLHEGGKEGRGWLLQLRMFLTHQNGSLWEGLSLWKNNLDKRFDGVEECCICYSIIHSSNFELPRVACRTCKKKFHRVCMYKWISTSTKSTCPICRNIF